MGKPLPSFGKRGADVGVFDVSDVTPRVKQLDSDIASLDVAVDNDRKKMLDKVNAGGSLTDNEKTRVKWFPDWTNFKLDWSGYKAKGIYLGNEDQLEVFEKRYRQLYKAYTDLPGSETPPTPPSPEPTPKPTLAQSITDTIKTIAIAVVGGVVLIKVLDR